MTNTALVPITDIERMAVAVAKSRLFGVETPDQAMALMLIAQAEGMHPAIAARDYHIIKGRPSLKADAMLARFQSAGGKVRWLAMTDARVAGEFAHPQGGSVEIEWTLDMAKRAGLVNNDNWRKYPRQMLRARCISEGIRTVFPGVVVGTYTPEEVQDFETPQQKPARETERDMGVAEVVATFNFAEWSVMVEDAQTPAELEEIWKAGIKVARESNDRDGYEAFKTIVQARGKAIKQQATQPPVDDEFVRQMDAAEAA